MGNWNNLGFGKIFSKELILILILISFFYTGKAKAELATRSEMDLVAQNWLSQISYEKSDWAGIQSSKIDNSIELKSGDTLLARIYNIDPKGFIVVPVLKEMMPVKMYSDESILNENQDAGAISMLRDILGQRMSLYSRAFGSFDALQPISGEAVFGQSQKANWDRLTLPPNEFEANLRSTPYDKSTNEAGPLLSSSWHQRAPYSDYCPMGDGGQTVVGCVATAAAQIMYYWQWPESGIGNHIDTWAGDNSCGGSTLGLELFADFSDSYAWAIMQDSCVDGCSQETNDALAELNYEVGVAFDMDYGACGSSSYGFLGLGAYPEHFKYSYDIERVNRTDYDLAGWYTVAQEEIDNNRPAHYRIHSHNIVLDGYRELVPGQYEYHMNYGWGNGFNAWYILDSLYCYWVPPDSLCPADVEYMLINIHPQYDPIISYSHHSLNENDLSCNGNGVANAGETIDLSLVVKNKGANAENTNGVLSTDDPYITLINNNTVFDNIEWGGSSPTQTPYRISIDTICPDQHIAVFEHTTLCDGGYSFIDTFYLFVGETAGFSDDMENGQGFWTHQSVTTKFGNEWHLEDYRYHSEGYSWKVGGINANQYSETLDAGLITPPFLLPPFAGLDFWHWIGAEEAWDGSIVMISVGDGEWEQIFPEGGYPYVMADNPASTLSELPCFSGYYDWTNVQFDLSLYSGVVQLMFRFASDALVNDEGWYIDDIFVESKFICGDVDINGAINILDVTRLIDFLYKDGDPLYPTQIGDVNNSGTTNILDITYLINYLYKDGPTPDCG